MDETVARCRELIAASRPAQHVVLNAGKCVLMQDEPDVRDIVARCDVVSADGQSVVWAARFLGLSVPERVAGMDLMGRLIARCESEGWPVYFLGAKDEVLAAFEAEALRRHPRVRRAARARRHLEPDEEAVSRAQLRAHGPSACDGRGRELRHLGREDDARARVDAACRSGMVPPVRAGAAPHVAALPRREPALCVDRASREVLRPSMTRCSFT